jgi:hypothetical protein
VDKYETNQCDRKEDVARSGPDMEETMGETPKASLSDLLLCLGPLSSSGERRHRFQLNPSDSLLEGPILSEKYLGSPSISSSQQISNPFFLPSLQQAPHRAGAAQAPYRHGAGQAAYFRINESRFFFIPSHLLSTYNGVYFNPLLEVVRRATHINRSGRVPFLVLYDGFSDPRLHRRGTSFHNLDFLCLLSSHSHIYFFNQIL